jgi:hypothetical protein
MQDQVAITLARFLISVQRRIAEFCKKRGHLIRCICFLLFVCKILQEASVGSRGWQGAL